MHVIGVIAEYNPFHKGHLYQINKIKEKYPNSLLVVVTSSSFTQRGNISLLNKWDKTKIALDNNVDLVVELPFVYSTQSSDLFAEGAISILNALKIDTLVFGTERDNISDLELLADIQINNIEYQDKVKEYLSQGLNYATSTNKALEDLTSIKVDTPNDLLALSYIKQIKKHNYPIKYINIKRTTSYHGSEVLDNITSASNIRKLYLSDNCIDNLVPFDKKYLYKIDMNKYYDILKYKILAEDTSISKYQTVDEGIESRIIKSIYISNNYEELIQNIKTKRYTYNKISRMLLHILVGFTKEEANNISIDYIRILGFTRSGQEYLNKIKKELSIPIVIGYKKNISKFENNLDLIRKASVYEYLFKQESEESKKHIGLIIGDKYGTPKEIISSDETGIDFFNMCGVMWGAIKEQQEEIEYLKTKLNEMEVIYDKNR